MSEKDCPRKYSVCVGLNEVDPEHYGSIYRYSTAASTARYYHHLFDEELDFHRTKLFDKPDKGTTKKFIKLMYRWSRKLDHGDLLVISFTGHGTRVPKKLQKKCNYYEEEGWRFFDRTLFFLELWELARLFRAGVRIIVLSDSCYSGIAETDHGPVELHSSSSDEDEPHFIEKWKKDYDPILSRKSRPMQWQVPASIVIMSASPEDGKAQECVGDNKKTVFGWAFEKAWNEMDIEEMDLYSLYTRIQKWVRQSGSMECGNSNDQRTRWHYYQGHTFTKLANKKGILKT